MKIKKAVIENFKGIRHLELDFCDSYSEEPRPLTAILGDNGSGKTSVLQALWLNLISSIENAKPAIGNAWEGLLIDRVSSLGESKIKSFLYDEDAIDDTHRIFDKSTRINDGQLIGTGQCPPGGLKELDYKLANVFFFTQNRNLGLFKPTEGFKNRSLEQDWDRGVKALRYALTIWWGAHHPPKDTGGKDYIEILEEYMNRVFPGTKIHGTTLKPRKNGTMSSPEEDYYFLFERDGKRFDVAEMSSGEQAVFTILYEFVRNDVKNGIILIDELELHLHPPEQQALLIALPKIGPDCQFIITTHSSYLEDIIPDRHEIRLEGGRLCL